MAQDKNNVRMADIARELGISTVAVSKALNNQKGVSEELRSRVKALAEKMGYQSPAQVRRLQGKTGYNIGVLIPTQYLGGSDSFYWRLYQEVTARAMKKDCFVLLELLTNEDAQAQKLPKLITEEKADGLIIIGKPPFHYTRKLKKAWQKPIVYLDFYDSDIGADSVLSNSFYGTFLLTQYLIRQGHREIGFVGTLLATDSINDRHLGFTKAMLEHQLAIQPQWIIKDRDAATGSETLPFELPEEMPTAFVCNCDRTASLLIHQLEKAGYRVPDDISVVGFDDYLTPGMLSMGLTTYAVDLHEMAHLAVRGILRRINGEPWKKGMHITDGELIIRDSVKNCK